MTAKGWDMSERLRRPAGIRSLQLGDTKVTYVPDGALQLSPRHWFPDTTDADWADHAGYLDEAGYLVAGVGGLLVERDDRALLIDSGLGPVTVPAEPDNIVGAMSGGALLDNLARLGRPAERIEAVAFTHLHGDHVGWIDHEALNGAEFLFSEAEWQHRDVVHNAPPAELLKAVEPRVRTVADGEEIFPGVRVLLTPGHTPGHAAYVISGGDRRLIAFGDAFHTPLQTTHPEWRVTVDHDAESAIAFRRRLAERLAEPGTVGFGIHFADVVFGRVAVDGGTPGWEPVDG